MSNISKNSKLFCPKLRLTLDIKSDYFKIKKNLQLISDINFKNQPFKLIKEFNKNENNFNMSTNFSSDWLL